MSSEPDSREQAVMMYNLTTTGYFLTHAAGIYFTWFVMGSLVITNQLPLFHLIMIWCMLDLTGIVKRVRITIWNTIAKFDKDDSEETEEKDVEESDDDDKPV